ncbi:uncharacterized protein BJ212DRAFT_951127 [Suillus subaureus]|uniref:Uncharacterized protein n=1 Tax=Suillus subaureus TaxID=48587 RepID=A0A9P7DVI8_9AGAM|nr:uncharacterized protein BJ212DRAFT_951127 [Suillus subaureus]KAG1803953.1 hypothetical protein BJ212DRAFT_951127 [Suillus subaureus]
MSTYNIYPWPHDEFKVFLTWSQFPLQKLSMTFSFEMMIEIPVNPSLGVLLKLICTLGTRNLPFLFFSFVSSPLCAFLSIFIRILHQQPRGKHSLFLPTFSHDCSASNPILGSQHEIHHKPPTVSNASSDSFVNVSSLDASCHISKDMMETPSTTRGQNKNQLPDIPNDWTPPSEPHARRVFIFHAC